MTEWSPIQSVIIWMINKLGLLQNRRLICLSWVWLQTKLDDKNSLPINQNYDKIWDQTRHLLYIFMKKKKKQHQLPQQDVRQQQVHMTHSVHLHIKHGVLLSL